MNSRKLICNKSILRGLIAIAIIFGNVFYNYAQEKEPQTKGIWLDGGFSGHTQNGIQGGFSTFLEGNFHYGKNIFKVRKRYGIGGGIFESPAPSNLSSFEDLSISYGRILGNEENYYWFTISGGVGYLQGKKLIQKGNSQWLSLYGSSKSSPSVYQAISSVLIVIEPEVILHLKVIGIGLGLPISVCSEGFIAGPALKIHLGKIQ